jgi:hypothetical protein
MPEFKIPVPEERITRKWAQGVIKHYALKRPRVHDLWTHPTTGVVIATRDYIYNVMMDVSRHYEWCGKYSEAEYVHSEPEFMTDDMMMPGYYEYARKWAAEGVAWAEYSGRLHTGFLEYVGEGIGGHGLEWFVCYLERCTRIMVHRERTTAVGVLPYIINSDPDFLRWYRRRMKREDEPLRLTDELMVSMNKYWTGVYGVAITEKVIA